MMFKSKIQNPKSKINPKFKCQISKQKFCNCLFICTLVFIIYFKNCYAQPIPSTELINNAQQYDGKTVVYEGEVVGDVMCRGDFCWVNLNDGQHALGIWLPKELTYIITYKGSYKTRGDWLEVSGIFNRSCSQHGGDLDIHAKEIQKLKTGEPILERINLKKRNIAIFLLGVLCIILILKRLKVS